MSLVYSLKLLSDLLFYMTFAGTISAMIGAVGRDMGNSGLLSTLPFLALSAVLLGALAERGKLKYLAFVPLLPAAVMALNYGVIHLVLIAPACAYIIYYATTLPYNIKTVGYTGIFRLYLCIVLPICLFFAVNTTFFGAFLRGALGFYLIMFVFSSIVLMRMLRHDSEILLQTRFKVMNSLSVALVIILGTVLGSPQGIQLMHAFLTAFYLRVIIPLLMLVFRIVSIILFPILALFGLVLEEWEVYLPEQNYQEFGEPGEVEFLIQERGVGLIIFQAVVFLGIAVIAFFVLRALFRFLTQKDFQKDGEGVDIERIFLGDNRRKKKKEPRVNHQIRQVYKKFLKLCQNKGITLHPSLTTEDIAKTYGSSVHEDKTAFALREIYIDSRYGEKTPSSADVKECRELYNKLKKM